MIKVNEGEHLKKDKEGRIQVGKRETERKREKNRQRRTKMKGSEEKKNKIHYIIDEHPSDYHILKTNSINQPAKQ